MLTQTQGGGVLDTECPLACGTCALAPVTVYSPTACADPTQITNLRKEIRHLAADKTIARLGENIPFLHTLESGWAFQFRMLSDRRRQILSFIIPGDIISLELLLWDAPALPFSVRSLTPVRLCTFERTAMKAVLGKTPAQVTKLAEEAATYMENVYRRTTDIGRRTARGRLAQLILELMSRLARRNLGSSESFPFPLKQEHIADALGLTVVYVNRTLTNLRKDGIVEFDRQKMSILNLEALQSIADED